MKTWLVLLLFGSVGAQASAQTHWFTVTGNLQDPAVNTVQVDPIAVSTSSDRKIMNVRVSRSADRVNWDGVPYRSYESQVAFDCRAGKAVYLSATYYLAPFWTGTPHNTSDYASSPRPMLFRDVEPNPTHRLVRAACRTRMG
ncbi:surface-adhesin E family protein [Variovorax sp. RT4R15]|uniref:surface-adhesin E family protein n=1 Tax=Variovorax sp. RT4R15 TaxID=3443737 RepID=UPI003F469202